MWGRQKKEKGQGKEENTGKHVEQRRGKEKGKTVWTVVLVIYFTFWPEAFLTNYTQASKPGCKSLLKETQHIHCLVFSKVSETARKQKENGRLFMFDGSEAKTTELCLSCPKC